MKIEQRTATETTTERTISRDAENNRVDKDDDYRGSHGISKEKDDWCSQIDANTMLLQL